MQETVDEIKSIIYLAIYPLVQIPPAQAELSSRPPDKFHLFIYLGNIERDHEVSLH